ncbi:MAG: arylsulfatase [Verrucomicrobiota bacterium]
MKREHRLSRAMLIAIAFLGSLTSGLSNQHPNIIFILVDDMGYSDLGCYGGEVKTPNIDRLAQNGIRFTGMYNTSKCFPSRACLLTGVYAQQCGMGRNAGDFKNAITIADLLRTVGYRTLAVGKHHSGKSLYDRGFDHFYGFHYGPGKSCANHFNPGEQRPGEGVPARKNRETRAYCFDDRKMLPYYTPEERDWYTTDYFTKWAIDFLEEYKNEDKPYFLYVSYTAPHDPLHAWPEDIAKYEGVYDAGYESIREARYERQKELGLFGADVRLSTASHRPWNSLSPEQKKDQTRRMQVYAAMIDRIDQNVGKLLKKVQALGEEENTLIMFASDNGCSAGNVNTGTGEIGSLTRWSSLQDDWANVSNSPFRFWKTLSHEGGIRTPFIAHWPKVISNKNGGLNHQPVHFVDVMATVQDITGASYPRTVKDQTIIPMQGESLLPALEGEQLPNRKNPIFFEYASGGAVRDGDWKLVTRSLTKKSKIPFESEIAWELYDMSVDMTETTDVAKENPEIVQRLSQLWQNWFEESYAN